MGRKGQVAFILLFAVALVLVVGALVSFVVFHKNNFSDKAIASSELSAKVDFGREYVNSVSELVMSRAILVSEKKDVESLVKSYAESAAQKDYGVVEAGNFFAKIRTREFEIVKEGEEYKLLIDGLFVKAENTLGQIRYDFEICKKFDSSGKYLGECVSA